MDSETSLPDRSFHDGYLHGIMTTGGSVELYLAKVSGEEFVATLSGVEHLAANDFWINNIILNIQQVSCKEPNKSDLAMLVTGPHHSATPQYHHTYALHLEGIAERIQKGELTFFVLASSYGCHILATCRDVVFRKK